VRIWAPLGYFDHIKKILGSSIWLGKETQVAGPKENVLPA